MFDRIHEARVALEAVARDFDPAELTGSASLRLMRELGAIRALVDGLVAKTAKRVDDTCAYMSCGDRNASQTVARALGVDASTVTRAIDTATKLEALPATDAAVRAGHLSSVKAEMIARAASHNPAAETALLECAREGLVPLKDACVAARAGIEDPADRSRRQHVSRSLRMWTDEEGMVAGRFRLVPELGGQVKAIVDAAVQRTFRDRRSNGEREPHEAYAADALADAFLGVESAKGAKVNVHIVIDHAALMRGHAIEGERCDIPGVGPVNAEWVRNLLGDAFVTAIIKKGADIATVAHLGRHIPAELRTALLVRGRECDIERCHQRSYLEVDHCEVDYAKGGPTAWWNLTWLCSVHHRRKSAGARLGPPDSKTRKRHFVDAANAA